MISIKTKKSRTKDTSTEYQWNPLLLEQVSEKAHKSKKSKLFLFWLEEMSRRSEKDFDAWLKDLSTFSKQDLLDIIHEMGPEAGRRFLSR